MTAQKMNATKPSTEERQQMDRDDGVIDLGQYFAVFRKVWWKILLLSLVIGVVTLLVTLLMPNIYEATAVITPAGDDAKQNPTLGVLSTFGIFVGGPTKVEDLESLFRSKDLTVRVFRKYNLWPIVFPDRFDPATGMLTEPWPDRLFDKGNGHRQPADWDAIRVTKKAMTVFINKKLGTVSISFDTPSPEGSAKIVTYYLDEGKSRLQEEALERATRNKKFIEEQMGKTVDALTKDRLYTLYGQEVEREMMARNRDQFGFKVIDSPRVPDRKTRPHRLLISLLTTILAFMVFGMILTARSKSSAFASKGP